MLGETMPPARLHRVVQLLDQLGQGKAPDRVNFEGEQVRFIWESPETGGDDA